MIQLEGEIESCRDLQFDFKVEECKEKCQSLLEIDSNLTEVRSIYGFTLQFTDPKQSIVTLQKVFEENPYFFKNTAFLLHIMSQQYMAKGKKFSNQVISLYEQYKGEKNGYFYISLSLAKQIDTQDVQASLESLLISLYNFKTPTQQDNNNEDNLNEKKELNNKEKVQSELNAFSIEERACLVHHLGREKMYNYFLDQQNKELFDESMQYLEQSLAIQPRNTQNMQLMGMLLVQQEQEEGDEDDEDKLNIALQIYQNAIEINEKDLVMNVYYCELLIKLGEYRKCEEVLEESMKQRQTPYVLNNYFQYVVFSYQYRFIDCEHMIGNLFLMLSQVVEYDQEEYYNYNSLCQLLYLIQYTSSFSKYQQHIYNICQHFSLHYPTFAVYMNTSLQAYHPSIQAYLNLIQKLIQEQSQRTHSLLLYSRTAQSQITFMTQYSHWDLYLL